MHFLWVFFCGVGLILPLMMIGIGWVFIKRPPKTINTYYGYRTKRSMQTQKTWAFAHHYIGKLWPKIGIFLLVVTLISLWFIRNLDLNAMSFSVITIIFSQLIALLLSIFLTERALKNTFGS